MTQWVHNHLEAAGKAFTERRDQTALRHLLQVLSVYPEEPSALKIAGKVLKLNTNCTGLEASNEPLSRTGDPRSSVGRPVLHVRRTGLHGNVDQRESWLFRFRYYRGCQSDWRAVLTVRTVRLQTALPPANGQCPGRATVCPACSGNLESSPPPNGRPSKQTVRLNKPLVHVLLFTEGPIQPTPNSLNDLFRMVAPDVFEDGAHITAFPVVLGARTSRTSPWRSWPSTTRTISRPRTSRARSNCATRLGRGLSCSKCSPTGRRLSIRGSGTVCHSWLREVIADSTAARTPRRADENPPPLGAAARV